MIQRICKLNRSVTRCAPSTCSSTSKACRTASPDLSHARHAVECHVDLDFVDLRHTAARLLIAQGATLHEVKEILGHSQIRLTGDLYGLRTCRRREKLCRRWMMSLLPAQVWLPHPGDHAPTEPGHQRSRYINNHIVNTKCELDVIYYSHETRQIFTTCLPCAACCRASHCQGSGVGCRCVTNPWH